MNTEPCSSSQSVLLHVVQTESMHTFHAIVGEAFTELIHHYEADAGWIIGPT